MSSDLLISAMTKRIERLEGLVAQQSDLIAEQQVELKEWRSGVRIRGKQRKRRRVRGARDAREAAEKGEEVGNRRSGHKGSG